jgi:hypothetical protein
MTDTGTAPFSLPAEGGQVVTVIGESLVDIIRGPGRAAPARVHPGGSPLNVAVGVARLNFASNLVTHYADDQYGLMIEDHVQSNGVTVIRGGSAPTSTATATLGSDGAATYTFDISWDLAGATSRHWPPSRLPRTYTQDQLLPCSRRGITPSLAFSTRRGSGQRSATTQTAGRPSALMSPQRVHRRSVSWRPVTSSRPAMKTWPGFTPAAPRRKALKPGWNSDRPLQP